MSRMSQADAAMSNGTGASNRSSFDPGPLGAEQVEIAVQYRGVCHSDLSVLDKTKKWDILFRRMSPRSQADKTPSEFFLAGVRAWEAGLRRRSVA